MKKKLQFLWTMMFSLTAMFVQSQEIPFHVRFSTEAASCYNNGKVVYALTDADGTVLESLPDGLSAVRIYHRNTPQDTIQYSGWYYMGGMDTLTINTGTYIIGVEALWTDGQGGYVRVDTQTVLNVTTTYVKPEASVLPMFANLESDAGNFPSMVCHNTGRVQMMIANGKFPYTVTVCDHDSGDTVRTCVFYDFQNQGSDGTKASYKYYYTFDTMAPGIWDYYLVDGCGYGLPRVTHQVNAESLPKMEALRLMASSGNFADTNVVRLWVVMDKNATPFRKYVRQYVKYRIVYEGLETPDWKPFPPSNGIMALMYDTVYSAEKYCDIWDRIATFEYKYEGCEEWSGTLRFKLQKPNEEFFEKDTANTILSIYDSPNACMIEWDWQRDYYSIRYYWPESYSSQPYRPDAYTTVTTSSTPLDIPYYRYRYTHPLTWVYTDTRTGEVIKYDTIGIITDHSFLRKEDVEMVYGSLQDTVLTIPVSRKLLDRKGCELYATQDMMTFFRCHGGIRRAWAVQQSEEKRVCCRDMQYLKVYELSGEMLPRPVRTIVRLVHSPDNDRYNFEALYDPETENWTVVRDKVENTAVLEGSYDGRTFYLKEHCLLTGPYWFEVITPCDTFILRKNAVFLTNDYVDQLEEPAYTLSRECGNLYLSYNAGHFLKTRYRRSASEDWADTVQWVTDPIINIVSAPHSSYINMAEFGLDTPVLVSMPGRYVFMVRSDMYLNSSCGQMELFDTVDITVHTVEFEYAKALLCDTSDTYGNAYVRGVNGTEPYTYTLFSGPDRQGEVLSVNQTGVFIGVPMRSNQEMSCLVADSCLSYFHVNFYPQTLAELKKVWFDDGMTVHTDCEGSTIQVHALSISDVLQYEWSGPDGFHATTFDPYIHIPRGGSSGWYKVAITYDECDQTLIDSIQLTVWEAPSIDIQVVPDVAVCPGDTVTMRFTASSPIDAGVVDFTVAFDNDEGIVVRQYSAANGQTVTERFSTLSATKVYPHIVQDGRCDYKGADAADTAYVEVRNDMPPACALLTTHDTVCVGQDARLTAKSTLPAPYTLKWFADYPLTQLLKTDSIIDEETWSYYDTAGITRRTVLYVTVEVEGQCPTVNGLVTHTMNMQDGSTVLECGQVYRLYDAGGPQGQYPILTETIHHFRSADGRPIAIHFEEFSLAQTAHLMVFTGEELHKDSLLFDLQSGSWNPGMLMSSGGVLTLYFAGGKVPADGWSAVVECAPGVAVADVWPNQTTVLADEVCQSQTRTYDDPYGVIPEFASAEELNQAMRQAGHYYFTRNYSGSGEHGCDSTVTFEFFVTPPPHHDTTVMVTTLGGGNFLWNDSLYDQSGSFSLLRTRPDDCDSLDVLHLSIVDVEISSENICQGDSANLSVGVSGPLNVAGDGQALSLVGHVLCSDGALLSPDSFLLSGKTAKGVVFYADASGTHGLAVALAEARLPMAVTMRNLALKTVSNRVEAIWDMEGLSNTRRIKNAVEASMNASFDTHAPAAKYGYYFDNNTLQEGSSHSGWYIPSMGELNLLYANRLKINETLRLLAGTDGRVIPMVSAGYWSSSAVNSEKIWIISGNGGITTSNIGNTFGTRPVIAF